ncbi:MAG: DUF3596 domain-containing protein [Synechococcaceae cyanobacterium SM2_3_60]|nr:DUF3596 domain-containing protein [Synechococcaceae cyanobacterium SM2_3_60]
MKISVEVLKSGRIRLRWYYQGKQVCTLLGMRDSPLARAHAQRQAAIIKADILSGNYDPSLLKYKLTTGKRGTVVSAVELWQHFYPFKTLAVKASLESFGVPRTLRASTPSLRHTPHASDSDTAPAPVLISIEVWVQGTSTLNLQESLSPFLLARHFHSTNPHNHTDPSYLPLAAKSTMYHLSAVMLVHCLYYSYLET